MFAEYTELQFLEECCNFTLNPANASKYEFMRETFQKFIQGKNNNLISQNFEILDSCILEKLRFLKINPAVYLVKSKYMLNEMEGKPWYDLPAINAIITQLRELIQNYLTTVLLYPDQFSPQRVLSDREKEQNQDIFQIIARLFEVFDQVNFDDEIFAWFIKQMTFQIDANTLHIKILEYVKFYVLKLHIFDSVQLYQSVFLYYFKNPQLKQQIFNGEIAKWNIQIGRGESLEKDFILSSLLQISLLQDNKYVIERAHSSLKGKITKKTFQNLLKQYQQTNQQHVEKLVEIFKLCLIKDYFPKTIQFFQVVCTANKVRETEKYSLMLKQRMNINCSSNGFLLNIFDVMLSLSNKISSRTDNTFEKIDKNFWLTVPFEGETMLISSKNFSQKQNIQIGNVSYLFFYTLKLLQVCFLPILLEFKESLKYLDEMKEQEELVKGTHLEQRFQNEKEQTEMKVHQLELCLFNSGRIKDIVQLLDTFIFLFDQWIGLSRLADGQYQWQPSELFSYLPEFLINNVFQFHESFLQYYEGYTEFLTPQKFINLIRLGVYLIHLPIAQNKYLAGNFIELIYLYTKQSSKNLNLSGIFCSDELIKENLLIGLLKQYYFVGATGENNQFYAKFSYRFYINDLLITLFKFPFYQQQFVKYQNSDDCHKLINAMVGDMNYGFEELWVNNLKTYITIKQQMQNTYQGKMQQQRQLQQYSSQCRANFQNFKQNLKLLVELSQYIPDVLTDDVFSKKIIEQLNYYLKVWMAQDSDTKANLELVKEVLEKKFKLTIIFQEIGYFFANISDFQKAVDTFLEDTRSFDIDNLKKLVSILKTNIAGQQDKVERLQKLIYKLQRRKEEKFIDDILSKEMVPPDRFLDPLTSEIMKDPVQLPKSKEIVDRRTIRQQILEKPIDPYTNTPLKIEDVIPQPKLQAEINDWLKKYNEKKEYLLKERLNKEMQIELNFQMTGNFQDDDDDENQQFKGRKYNDE